MKFGIDRLLEEPALRKPLAGERVALLAHPASMTAELEHTLDALAAPSVSASAVVKARYLTHLYSQATEHLTN